MLAKVSNNCFMKPIFFRWFMSLRRSVVSLSISNLRNFLVGREDTKSTDKIKSSLGFGFDFVYFGFLFAKSYMKQIPVCAR